jgi:hypothetical protein
MAQEEIQPIAFHVVEQNMNPSLVCMSFPEEWRGPLNELANLKNGRRADHPNTFPIYSLNAAIAAFTPQLFITPNQAFRSNEPWLLATEEIRPDKILRIVHAWLAEQYSASEDLAEAYDNAHQAIREEDLKWKPFHFTLTQSPHPNGTANIGSLNYAILPAFVANSIVKRGIKLKVQGHECGLVRVPISNGGAELQTWPPVEYTEEGTRRRAAYSYIITITLQTLVGSDRPRIHFSYGVRRWRIDPLQTQEALYLPNNEGRTVYIRHPQPLRGIPYSSHFTQATLEVVSRNNQRIPVWRENLAEIAARIGVWLPQPKELTASPEGFLFPVNDDGVVAAIVEKTPRYHPVGAGMGLEEREAITIAIATQASDLLSIVPRLERSKVTLSRQRNQTMLGSDLRGIPVETRLQAVKETIGSEFVIEIYYQTEACRDQLIESIHSLLTGERPDLEEIDTDDDTSSEEIQAIQLQQFLSFDTNEIGEKVVSEQKSKKTKRKRLAPERPNVNTEEDHDILLPDGGYIRVSPIELGSIGEMLPEPSQADQQKRGEYKRRETQRRAQKIANELGSTNDVPTLALIELPNFQDPQNSQRRSSVGLRDPKIAIRLGMAQTGRITKFTTGQFRSDQKAEKSGRSQWSAEELLRKRCENAVLEGLRQMGYIPASIAVTPPTGHSFPEEMTVVGVRMLRLTRRRTNKPVYLPVVTIFDSKTPGVHAWLPDDHIGVRSFYQAMLDITRFKDRDVAHFQQEKMLARLDMFLTTQLPEIFGRNIVILVEAQNMRSFWPALQNGNITTDALSIRRNASPIPIGNLQPRFRLIRLRTTERSETPQWYTPNASPGRDYMSGLFRESGVERTFYNIAVKPKTQGKGRRGKQQDPSEQYAIPSMLEIFVAIQQPDDNDEAWALAIHTWRRMSYLSGGDMTLLPIPLQWAQRMDRYAEVIGPWVFPTQEHLWINNDIDDEVETQLSLFDDDNFSV